MMIFDMMEISKKARITRNLRMVRIIGVSASEVKMHQSIDICSVFVVLFDDFDMMEVSRKLRITRNLRGMRIISYVPGALGKTF